MRNQIGSGGPTVIFTLEISYEFTNYKKEGRVKGEDEGRVKGKDGGREVRR